MEPVDEEFDDIEALAKEILHGSSNKTNKIKMLNKMNVLLNEKAEANLQNYIVITKRGVETEAEKKLAEEIINNEKKYDDIFEKTNKSKHDMSELLRIKNELEAAEKAYWEYFFKY
jgi:hypothetical protein